MGMEVETRVVINAPLSKVWALSNDLDRCHEWMPNFVSIERIGSEPGEFGVGTTFRESRKMMGHVSTEQFEVLRFEPEREVEIFIDGSKGSSKKGKFFFTFGYHAQSENVTELVLHTRVEDGGCAMGCMGWAFKGMFKKMIRKDHAALKAWIEAQ